MTSVSFCWVLNDYHLIKTVSGFYSFHTKSSRSRVFYGQITERHLLQSEF